MSFRSVHTAFQRNAFQFSAFQIRRYSDTSDGYSDAADPKYYEWWRQQAKSRKAPADEPEDVENTEFQPAPSLAIEPQFIPFPAAIAEALAAMPPLPIGGRVQSFDLEKDDEEAILVLMMTMQ